VKFGKYLLYWLYRMNVHAKPEASVCVYNYGGVEPSNLWLWGRVATAGELKQTD